MPECLVIVEGIDARCPLCHRVVGSGTRHECNGRSATNELLQRKPVISEKVKPKVPVAHENTEAV